MWKTCVPEGSTRVTTMRKDAVVVEGGGPNAGRGVTWSPELAATGRQDVEQQPLQKFDLLAT